MENKGLIFPKRPAPKPIHNKRLYAIVPILDAISAIVNRENDENFAGDFSQNSVWLPSGKEITTYAKLTDALFVLERLQKDYGFDVNPMKGNEYIIQTDPTADADNTDWFETGKGGGFRYALAVELEAREAPIDDWLSTNSLRLCDNELQEALTKGE